MPPRSAARRRATGSPRTRAAPTKAMFARSWRRSSVRLDHRHEEVGDARLAHLAQLGELLPVGALGAVDQQNAASEHLPLLDRPECAGGLEAVRADHHFEIARL